MCRGLESSEQTHNTKGRLNLDKSICVFGSISDSKAMSKVCGGRFSFSFFLTLLALGVVVRGKTVDQPTPTGRCAPYSLNFNSVFYYKRLFAKVGVMVGVLTVRRALARCGYLGALA